MVEHAHLGQLRAQAIDGGARGRILGRPHRRAQELDVGAAVDPAERVRGGHRVLDRPRRWPGERPATARAIRRGTRRGRPCAGRARRPTARRARGSPRRRRRTSRTRIARSGRGSRAPSRRWPPRRPCRWPGTRAAPRPSPACRRCARAPAPPRFRPASPPRPTAKRRRGAPRRLFSSSASNAVIDGQRSRGSTRRPRSTILRTHDGTLLPAGAGRTVPSSTPAMRSSSVVPVNGRSP